MNKDNERKAWWQISFFKIKWDLGEFIILFALVVSIPRMIGAFSVVETELSIFENVFNVSVEVITGLGFSVLVTLGAMYCWKTFNSIITRAAKNKKVYPSRYIPLGFAAAQTIMELLLVWPVLAANLVGETLFTVLDKVYMVAPWTFLAAALPIVVVAGVASSSALRNALSDELGHKANAKARSSDNKSNLAKNSDYKRTCGFCDGVFHNANSFSGHHKEANHAKLKQLVSEGQVREVKELTSTHYFKRNGDEIKRTTSNGVVTPTLVD